LFFELFILEMLCFFLFLALFSSLTRCVSSHPAYFSFLLTRKFLLEWSDGAPASWVEEKHLVGSDSLEEWDMAEEEGEEIICSDDILQNKVEQLVRWIRELKEEKKQNPVRIVWHVGAGLSAGAGVPTFRGKKGLWTRNRPELQGFDLSSVQPGYSHRALVALQRAGYVYHVVSQNYDNLLGRAGLVRARMSEIHGNIFQERCPSCAKIYERATPVERESNGVLPGGGFDHRTGRFCETCPGEELLDTLVHFGEGLKVHLATNSIEYSTDRRL